MINIHDVAMGLVQDSDGIWRSSKQSPVSYPTQGHERCAQIEEMSFWFRHRNACITALVERHPPARGGTIFDIGGGNGFVSMGLMQSGFDVVVLEPGPMGVRAATMRGIRKVICSTLENAEFLEESLPAVGLFDVIEHLPDDESFLTSIHSLLQPGGRLYLTVPAFSSLWSCEDDDAGHFRRYNIQRLTDRLRQTGFSVDFASYIFRPLPLPILLTRTIPSKISKRRRAPLHEARAHFNDKPRLRNLLLRFLHPEVNRIKTGRPMMFGASCIAAATRH